MSTFIIETCVETLHEAVYAEQNGAHRIELCSRLDLDGLTPSRELIMEVTERLEIPVNVMIRPREGGFVYASEELSIMESAITFCKNIPVNGVVFGVLSPKNELDIEVISRLAKLAAPLDVTIHKAIDLVTDPVRAVRQLKEIPSVTGILTSGTAKTAVEGSLMLKKMLAEADEHLTIIAAGSITKNNLEMLHKMIGAKAYHGRKITGNLNF